MQGLGFHFDPLRLGSHLSGSQSACPQSLETALKSSLDPHIVLQLDFVLGTGWFAPCTVQFPDSVLEIGSEQDTGFVQFEPAPAAAFVLGIHHSLAESDLGTVPHSEDIGTDLASGFGCHRFGQGIGSQDIQAGGKSLVRCSEDMCLQLEGNKLGSGLDTVLDIDPDLDNCLGDSTVGTEGTGSFVGCWLGIAEWSFEAVYFYGYGRCL